jgi:hypothetical protein
VQGRKIIIIADPLHDKKSPKLLLQQSVEPGAEWCYDFNYFMGRCRSQFGAGECCAHGYKLFNAPGRPPPLMPHLILPPLDFRGAGTINAVCFIHAESRSLVDLKTGFHHCGEKQSGSNTIHLVKSMMSLKIPECHVFSHTRE